MKPVSRRTSLLLLIALAASPLWGDLIPQVRAAIAQNDLAAASRQVAAYRATRGVTPEMLEAMSWIARGALAGKKLDQADIYAIRTRKLVSQELRKRHLDAETHLPMALGAAIEVQAQVAAARGQRGEAVEFLREQLRVFRNTSIRARIQKNLNLLALEGKPAPELPVGEYLPGARPRELHSLKGKPVLLFFWAHWCTDCKSMEPALAKLRREQGPRGLVIVAPTQHYGYGEGGLEIPAAAELQYMEEVWRRYYPGLPDVPRPVSEESFKNYGASTTPTLVLVDREGLVAMYHPGRMSYDELRPRVEALVSK